MIFCNYSDVSDYVKKIKQIYADGIGSLNVKEDQRQTIIYRIDIL